MARPSVTNYLEASNFTYNNGVVPSGAPDHPTGYSGTFSVATNHYGSPHDYDVYNRRTGLYAAAYTIGSGANQQIVVSFEGTNTSLLATQPQFAISQLRADYRLYKGELPVALQQAARFTQAVIASAAAQNIPADRIHLTGHSLGAAEAEYADVVTGLNGTTFGTPGISSDYVPAGSVSGLTNYVERGDPVGNYAYTGAQSPEGAFIYNDTIEHFGVTRYLGSKYDAIPLQIAGAAYGTGVPALQAGALAGFYAAAETFHPLSVYAGSLHHALVNPPAGSTSLDTANVATIVAAIAQRQGG